MSIPTTPANLTAEQTKTIAEAISHLALAETVGDAHEAGLLLAKLLWGKAGAEAYDAYTDQEPMRVSPRLSELLQPHEPSVWNPEDDEEDDDDERR